MSALHNKQLYIALIDRITNVNHYCGIVSGYVAGVDAISDFVRITDNGTDTTISVDANGAQSGARFTKIATLSDVTNLSDDSIIEVNAGLI